MERAVKKKNKEKKLGQRDSLQVIMSPAEPPGGSKGVVFWAVVFLAQALGLACVGMVFYWMTLYNGFAWLSNADLQFNYHPAFMVLGLVFLYGDALIVYRVLSFLPKKILKVIHATLHISAIAFASVALVAVLENHRRTEKADFYSLHSWIGIATFALFDLQYVTSFISFMWPGLPLSWRAKIMPFHTFLGLGVFVMAIATALMGITEKLLWTPQYTSGKVIDAGVAGNALGVLLVAFAFSIVFLTTRSAYKRQPLPHEVPKAAIN